MFPCSNPLRHSIFGTRLGWQWNSLRELWPRCCSSSMPNSSWSECSTDSFCRLGGFWIFHKTRCKVKILEVHIGRRTIIHAYFFSWVKFHTFPDDANYLFGLELWSTTTATSNNNHPSSLIQCTNKPSGITRHTNQRKLPMRNPFTHIQTQKNKNAAQQYLSHFFVASSTYQSINIRVFLASFPSSNFIPIHTKRLNPRTWKCCVSWWLPARGG